MRRAVTLALLAVSTSALVLPAACSDDGATTPSSGNGGGSSTSSSASSSSSTTTTTTSSSAATTGSGGGSPDDPCSLPGSIQFTQNGSVVVPGAPSPVDLSFLHLPAGFCAHYFATIGNARQLRFAPGGELFVASPTGLTTGGGPDGKSAIVVLADDDHDGVADAPLTFLDELPKTQGLLFTPGWFYYQDDTKIMRVAYATGDRAPSGPSEQVANITYYSSSLHWPKTMDIADDGSIYVGNGGDQGETCVVPHPFHGGIRKLDGTPDGEPIAQGLRNPIAVRCPKGHDRCFALELAKDYSGMSGGREKLIPIRKGDDWGFPCCATQDLPYPDVPQTDCSGVVPEDVGFTIGDTPFGLAFPPSSWPAPYGGSAIVATHGAAGTFVGARIVSIGLDPSTGLPLPGGNVNGQDTGSMVDFATGWDDGTQTHGRPAAVDLSADGRLFVASDLDGVIFWIAPMPQ